jgi:hypothetical protein
VQGGLPEDERRRLAGMLPGAEIETTGGGEVVALVRDLDAPIPVLVERGGYEYPVAGDAEDARCRRLRRGPVRLVLVDDRAEFARLVRG